VVVRSETRVCYQSLAGIAGWNPAGGLDVLSICVLSGKGSCAGPSLVQRSPTECGRPERDHEEALAHWGLLRHGKSRLVAS
jgi:hypothetical protein